MYQMWKGACEFILSEKAEKPFTCPGGPIPYNPHLEAANGFSGV
jgi:hypothetical protein